MTRRRMVSVIVVGGLIAAGAVVIGRSAWSRGTARTLAHLRQQDGDGAALPGTFSPAQIEDLPPPVRRYFAFVLRDGQPVIARARLRWSGGFQSRPAAGWAPFTALQHFTTRPPGFVWEARIHMLPLLPVHVRDSYLGATGSMLGSIGGLVPVVDQRGTPELAQSALARWLGEAVWFPTALLPGGGVEWEAVDDSTARATVSDGDVRVSAEFRFASTGEITRMTAMRYRDVGGTAVLTPFEGSYGRYERRAGVMLPAEAEVAWVLPEGRFPYWRGSLESVEYEPYAAAAEVTAALPPAAATNRAEHIRRRTSATSPERARRSPAPPRSRPARTP